ncbi:MAG TPA: metallophosphoesterase [Gemmatimonadaceae bacterium]|nr:metallophosphoesterase [Gemmatimonadaceae bacterium]
MRILHASDLHFGRHCQMDQVAALEQFVSTEPLDAIILSGDLSQRTRRREFTRASAFVRRCESRAPTVVVPGNHDCAWWTAFLGIGDHYGMFARYREFIRADLEPEVSIPGATIVGLNSAHGIQSFTLTRRLRDLSVVGAVRGRQWEKARVALSLAPPGNLRILVLHHNLLRGAHSRRYGLATRALALVDAAYTGADVICCGHDHEQRVDEVEVARRRIVVSTAGTLTDRARGGRAGSWNLIEADAQRVSVAIYEWDRDEFRRMKTAAYARPPA